MKFSIKVLFLTFLMSNLAFAQTASILPPAKTVFLDQNGKPLTSGTVDFYIPSTTTRKTTWQDAAETIPNTNPVVLDGAGRALILGSGSYRQVVKDRLGNLIWDQVTSSTGSGGSTPTATGDGDLVGTIKPWAGLSAPNQYMFTYGQEVSRTTYSALYTAITSTQSVFCNSGSPILSGLSDTTNFPIGAAVEISCVVSGSSTILSKTSTSITLNANANVTVNTNAIIYPWGNGNGTTTFNLPDFRGFAIAGNNNMGGVASSILTTTYFGSANPNSIGAAGGSQSKVLLTANLPPYTPAGTNASSAVSVSATGLSLANYGGGNPGLTGSASTGSSQVTSIASTGTATAQVFTGTAQGGTSTAFATVQPTKTSNYIIKVTPDANSATASGVTSLGGMTGSIACGSGTLCTGNTISVVFPANCNLLGGFLVGTGSGAQCSTVAGSKATLNGFANFSTPNAVFFNLQTPGVNPTLFQMAAGSMANPITAVSPTVALSRYEAISLDAEGGQNAPLAISLITNGTSVNGSINAQGNGITVNANQIGNGDQVGGVFNVTNASGTSTGRRYSAIGLFANAVSTGTSNGTVGLNTVNNNSSGADCAYASVVPGGSTCGHIGLFVQAIGANSSSAGALIYGTGQKFDVGYAVASSSVLTAAFISPGFSVDGTGNVTALSYYLNSNGHNYQAMAFDGTATNLFDQAGAADISVSNATNFYSNTTHTFRNRNASISWATFNASGLTLGVGGSLAFPLIFANATSGSITVQAPTGALGTVSQTLQAATDTFVYRDTTDTFTHKTFDTGGTGNVFKIAGTTISSISGNVAELASATGTFTSGNCVKSDVNHNLIDAGTTCGGGGSGTVTSVSFTGGLISVATATTTPALTVAGTSGGIPYFSGTTTWASSALLAANAIMIGGGSGTAPSTTTTGTGVLTALGINTGSAGAFVVNGGALGTPSSGTVTNLTGTASININGTVGATTPTTATFTTASATTFSGALTGHASLDLALTGGTITGAVNHNVATTVASATSATLDDLQLQAATTTITGTTAVTTGQGFNKFSIYQPTYTDASAVTITNAGTLYLGGPPLAAGSVTLTNTYTVAMSGQVAETIAMYRETTASTAGNNLTVQAGGATSGGSNLQGGNLVLSAGIATGNAGGTSALNGVIIFNGPNLGSAGGATADVTPIEFARLAQIGGYGTLCFAGTSCGASNYVIQGINGVTNFNSGGFMDFRISNSSIMNYGVTTASVWTDLVATTFTSGTLILSGLTTDAAKTDRTVCQQTSNGQLFFGSGTLGICLGTSGRQFKTAFEPMVAGIDEITRLDLLNYRYKEGFGDNGERLQYGLTAQGVASVMPDLVRYDAQGEAVNFDIGALLPVALHAIQQLKINNDSLEQRLTKLENQR
jgi:hypothetical protein